MSEDHVAPAEEADLGSSLALDLGLCKACGICIALCPEHVFDATELGEPVLARPGDCTACLLCELHCPDYAIEVRRRREKRAVGVEAAELDEDDEADAHEAHAGRVFAALAGQSAEDRAGSGDGCVPPEEH